jgi:hypothetical protein
MEGDIGFVSYPGQCRAHQPVHDNDVSTLFLQNCKDQLNKKGKNLKRPLGISLWERKMVRLAILRFDFVNVFVLLKIPGNAGHNS